MSKISFVIITTGRNKQGLIKLFKSLSRQKRADYEIEIVIATESNGHELRDLAYQLTKIPNIKVVETGYWNRCRTANLAIISSEGEFVVLLEDDVELESQWLQKMLKCINIGRDIGCAYPIVINPLGSESVLAKSNSKVLRFMVKAINVLRVHHHFRKKNLDVFSLTVICKREALLKAELFDMRVEEPIVGEDYDLALRIKKAGHKVIACTEAKAFHYTFHIRKRALLALKRGPKWWGKLVENNTYFFAKHYDLLGLAVYTHALYNALLSPLALLLSVKSSGVRFGVRFFIEIFLRSMKGSFTGLIRGILTRHKYLNIKR